MTIILIDSNNANAVVLKSETNAVVTVAENFTWTLGNPVFEENTCNNSSVTVLGSIVSKDYVALTLNGYNTNISIGANAVIDSVIPIVMNGQKQSLTNYGVLEGANYYGVSSYGAGATITNYGNIKQRIYVSGAESSVHLKGGSSTGGITLDVAAGGSCSVDNSGTIEKIGGDTYAVRAETSYSSIDFVNAGIVAGDVRLGLGRDSYTAQAGSQQGSVAGEAGDDTYTLWTSVKILEKAGEGIDTIKAYFSLSLASAAYAGQEIENVTLMGSGNLNVTGNALANTMTGNAGKNVIDGGAGADLMAGGAGNDTYIVDNAGDRIIEAAGSQAGVDTIRTKVDYTLQQGVYVETIVLLDSARNAIGNNLDNTLVGNKYGNVLIGNGGRDILNGGAGADAMFGGSGNDDYYVDNARDRVTEAKGAGTDRVYSKLSWTLGGNVENLTLQGTGNINGKGNGLANTIVGNSGANTLSGLGGADRISGGGGKDRLDGGAGNDILTGGGANDTFVFSGHFNKDRITDFSTGHDRIDLHTFASLKSFGDVHDLMQQKGDDVVIKVTSTDWITIAGHKIADFGSHDFLL